MLGVSAHAGSVAACRVVPAPTLLALRGGLVVVGTSPGGDSVRLGPDSAALPEERGRGFRVLPRSVELRLGVRALDELLEQDGDGVASGAHVLELTFLEEDR